MFAIQERQLESTRLAPCNLLWKETKRQLKNTRFAPCNSDLIGVVIVCTS